MKSILCTFALLLALFVPPARAQAVADSPEAVAEAMYARMQAGEMRGAAALFDPAALKEFRGMMAPVVFRQWGLRRTDDFGNIVFNLIRAEKLSKSDRDEPDDFRDLFDIDAALTAGFDATFATGEPQGGRGDR